MTGYEEQRLGQKMEVLLGKFQKAEKALAGRRLVGVCAKVLQEANRPYGPRRNVMQSQVSELMQALKSLAGPSADLCWWMREYCSECEL